MTQSETLTQRIPDHLAGLRLDQALTELFPEFSRSRIQQWIREGRVRVDARRLRPRDPVAGGEWVELDASGAPATGAECLPEPIALQVVHRDEALLVIDKPAGLVVHPGAGNRAGTLQNALLHYLPALAELPRAGLVHRLDKDTSGLLVVAVTLQAHARLVAQLQSHLVEREYEALVNGFMTGGGTVEGAIGRHATERTRMAVSAVGRPALTHYRVVERYRAHTRIRVNLETGRTHQIRVHMSHIHYPLLGDPVYGGRARVPAGASPALLQALQGFRRQALHAGRLALQHPVTAQRMEWRAPLPEDLHSLIAVLREDAVEGRQGHS